MQITTVKDLGNKYRVNGTIFIPKEGGRQDDLEAVQQWIDAGGIVDPEFSVLEIKNILIEKIKSETYQRITSVYPEYKQRNLNGAVSEIQNKEVIALKAGQSYTPTETEMTLLRAVKACKEFVDGLRTKSNQLEVSLDSMTEEQLNAFNPSEDSHWE